VRSALWHEKNSDLGFASMTDDAGSAAADASDVPMVYPPELRSAKIQRLSV
jgi:hypothetical protein